MLSQTEKKRRRIFSVAAISATTAWYFYHGVDNGIFRAPTYAALFAASGSFLTTGCFDV